MQKWGNSYGIRLPKQMVDNLQIREKSVLYLSEREDGFELKVNSKEKQLAQLISQMDEQDMPELVDWGEPVGKEFW